MITYFYGEDTYGASQAVAELARKHTATVRSLDREDLEKQPLGIWLEQSSGGLFGKDLIVIRDPSTFPKALQEVTIETLKKMPSSLCVLWDREEVDRRGKLFKFLAPYATEYKRVEGAALETWVVEEAKKKNATIEIAATRLLIERIGYDRWQLSSELEKLSLRSGTITIEQVRVAIPEENAEAQIFHMLDAMTRSDARSTMQQLDALLAAGHSEFYILSMLAYQFKTLLAIRRGVDQGLPAPAIAKQERIHPYVVGKHVQLVRAFSAVELLNNLTKVMATDFAIKQGKVDARTALLMLCLGFVQQKTPAM